MFHPPPSCFQEKIDWLRLWRTPTVGALTFWKILKLYGTAEEALKALHKQGKTLYQEKNALEERTQCLNLGIQFVFYGETRYPFNLLNLEDAPPVVQIKGNFPFNERPCIALVGARNASIQGRRFAQKLAQDLGQQGIVVVSGLARGIDTAAHQGSLATGTMGVLAGGIDKIYPLENEKLHHSISQQGILISEIPLGIAPLPTHFPRRNRLISGMSLGTVIIEAGLNSGSLLTADFALKQGRDVFAVPGFPTDPHSSGSNYLLKQGAILVETAADIIKELPLNNYFSTPTIRHSTNFGQDKHYSVLEKNLLSCLKNTPIEIDSIIQEMNQKPDFVLKMIGHLENEGQIIRHLGNRISLNDTSYSINKVSSGPL